MRTDDFVTSPRTWSRSWRAAAYAFGVTMALILVFVVGAAVASGQTAAPVEQARVPTSYANVHEQPGSGSAVLVLAARGTVLPIVGRRGEWVQVRLSPDVRTTGMVMRWYEGPREIVRRGRRITIGDEDSGWMHDSTVEISPVSAP